MEIMQQDDLKTGPLGKFTFDDANLREALVAIDAMPSNNAYSSYNLIVDPRKPGAWTQIVLGNWSGDATDGESMEYEGHFRWTEEGRKVPFVQDLIESRFRCEYLKSVRVFSADNAMIVSHRDYIEFRKGFRRLHIPLRTNNSCMNSESSLVYHMCVGSIYFLDGREAHAGGNLSSGESRIHLVLDFDPDVDISDLFIDPKRDLRPGSINQIARPILHDGDAEKFIDGFAVIISQETYPVMMLAANMLPFLYEFDTSAVYDIIVEAAMRAGKSDIENRARCDRKRFLGVEQDAVEQCHTVRRLQPR